jgi:hypothetical protein
LPVRPVSGALLVTCAGAALERQDDRLGGALDRGDGVADQGDAAGDLVVLVIVAQLQAQCLE